MHGQPGYLRQGIWKNSERLNEWLGYIPQIVTAGARYVKGVSVDDDRRRRHIDTQEPEPDCSQNRADRVVGDGGQDNRDAEECTRGAINEPIGH